MRTPESSGSESGEVVQLIVLFPINCNYRTALPIFDTHPEADFEEVK